MAEWTAPQKAGMRTVKTGGASILAYFIFQILEAYLPKLATPEVLVILTSVFTGLWTWFKNRKK